MVLGKRDLDTNRGGEGIAEVANSVATCTAGCTKLHHTVAQHLPLTQRPCRMNCGLQASACQIFVWRQESDHVLYSRYIKTAAQLLSSFSVWRPTK